MVLDGAGWHRARDLVMPENIELVFLLLIARNSTAPNMCGRKSEKNSSPIWCSTVWRPRKASSVQKLDLIDSLQERDFTGK
jgi:hypothetical protein